MLNINNTVLIIIDVQGKLAQVMYEKDRLFVSLQQIIRGIQVLEIPILWAEQLPDKLGPTVAEVKKLLQHIDPVVKNCFSCCANTSFVQQLEGLKRKQVLLTGIEAHVCVYQTAADLVQMGYEAHVVADAVSSRTSENKNIGLDRMKDLGVKITSVETALFELLKIARGDQFKKIINIVK